jgi:hypothetical protein
MTPESIRLLSSLRSEFYTQFVAAMQVPVKISGSSYNSISFVASWLDNREQLNYLNIYAYTAPDELSVNRPFILRVAINKGAGNMGFARQGQAFRGVNQKWQLELTLLPDQLIDFLPWVVDLVKVRVSGGLSFTEEPPHPVTLELSNWLLTDIIWSTQAEQKLELQALEELAAAHSDRWNEEKSASAKATFWLS